MRYRCLSQQQFSIEPYTVVPIREEDILLIKEWRNEQMEVLRQNAKLTDEGQKRYYVEAIKPSFDHENPRLILFSYLRDNQCIGYGGLTNVDWAAKRAEISFLLDTARTHAVEQYQVDFAVFLELMKQVAFRDIGLNRLFTETFDIRPHHLAVIEKAGFCLEGRMKQHAWADSRLVDSLIHGYLKEYYNAKK
ncbi:GNAT family N-acetyltransferase [Ammoniphilus sp. CFH 90114]|uniref:GNAT family N-acetyltransferase n=1 Tax=Ammoniphilus sp. CFH 90114 TaxID=2493665 RepID=UPI0013E973BB|nr:GNAT family N-acetyltransferase [Ammoniphilus sp. CFH 90114]